MYFEVILVLFLVLIWAVLKDKKPATMPPGPFEIPFVGNVIADTTEALITLREKYGKIYTIRLGVERTVVIADYDLAKEAMASIECADRTPGFKIITLNPTLEAGVVCSNGFQWVHDRRFVLRHLRDLGMGKTYLQTSIQNEAEAMVKFLKDFEDNPTPTPSCFRGVVLNVIWQMVSGKRYELTSTEVDKIFHVFEKFGHLSNLSVFVEAFFPIIKRIIPKCVKQRLFNSKILDDFKEEITNILELSIREHQNKFDEDNPKDLIDDYLIAMKNNANSSQNQFQMVFLYQILSDLFFAGSNTVTNMLRWVVFLMVKYPDAMIKAQKQIDEAVPADRLVCLEDKHRLPYVEAYLAESLRYSSMIFTNPQRFTNRDYKLGGFFIPKGTAVTVDNYFIHHDPEYWKNPSSFNPDRFLDETGKFNSKLGRNFAFGSGKRECIGVPLAMMEFYLFSTALLQNFTIEVPKGLKLDQKIGHATGNRIVPSQTYIYKYRQRSYEPA